LQITTTTRQRLADFFFGRGEHKAGRIIKWMKTRTRGDAMSRLLNVEEVASLLNVPRKWVYRRAGLKPPDGIPYLKVGKYLRFRESDLRDYVERLRRR
jgi:excisionase family DNA binding protein